MSLQTPTRIRTAELLEHLPPPWPDSLLSVIRATVAQRGEKIIVLDDDPTGTQTVYDVPVLTMWKEAALQAEFQNSSPLFYILTNSRSFPVEKAIAMNREIGERLARVAHLTGRPFVVISRSDSTLRGHFPDEVEALAQALGGDFDAWLIIPFFEEGGRLTVDDVHYVVDGEWAIPAGETEFAQDPTFGYRSSNLREWVLEKSRGRFPADLVDAISLAEIRQGGPEQVAEHLLALPKGSVCIVNAACTRDLEVFVAGLLAAEAQGRRYLYRTAASFVRVRAGLAPRPCLRREELNLPANGGSLFVVGSFVNKTTRQVHTLLAESPVIAHELDVHRLLSDREREDEIATAVTAAEDALRRNQDIVLYTSRTLVRAEKPQESLHTGQRISAALVEIVRRIRRRPRYLVAKGGITSSDVATGGLQVKRALVRGQILPGVPVWELGPESRYPGLIYIVFPGNVGDDRALLTIWTMLK